MGKGEKIVLVRKRFLFPCCRATPYRYGDFYLVTAVRIVFQLLVHWYDEQRGNQTDNDKYPAGGVYEQRFPKNRCLAITPATLMHFLLLVPVLAAEFAFIASVAESLLLGNIESLLILGKVELSTTMGQQAVEGTWADRVRCLSSAAILRGSGSC